MYNCTPPAPGAKTLSPFTYYQPFQSSFDPDFFAAGAKSVPRQPPQGKALGPGGLQGGAGRPPQPPPAPLPRASTSGWAEGNSTGGMGRGPCFGEGPSGGCLQFDPAGGSRAGAGGAKAFGGSSEGHRAYSSYYPLVLAPLAKSGGYRPGHGQRLMMCNFCKNNKEVPDIYLNHYLYDPETRVLSCPVLRKHVCEICGGTGDQAHTLQYCPVNKERGLQTKVPILLKARTITNSTGKIRRN